MCFLGRAYARAGLVGNPSDGYNGKTISFIIRNFRAEVTLEASDRLEILANQRDLSVFDNLEHLAKDVRQHGYYGGIRLLKATVRRFYAHCQQHEHPLHEGNFSLRYQTDIPDLVGLAGSSAIITACLRALMEFYHVGIARPIQANLIRSVEAEELGIPAGWQDRVIQVYEGLVYMDFNHELMKAQDYGYYEPLDPALLPPLYVAYRTDLAEGTEVHHNDLKSRYERDDPAVLAAIAYWADLTDQVRSLLLKRQPDQIGELLNRNFDKRREICAISRGNQEFVETARATGASAKFAGSGGAIVGTYRDEAMYEELRRRLEALGAVVFKPQIEPASGETTP
jgi:glucuronokinase